MSKITALLSGFIPTEPARESFVPIARDVVDVFSISRLKTTSKAVFIIQEAVNYSMPVVPMGHDYRSGFQEFKNHIGARAVQPEVVEKPIIPVQTAEQFEVDQAGLLEESRQSDHQSWVNLLSQAAVDSAQSGEETNAHIAETTERG